VEVELEPGSSRFAPDDERWLAQVADFASEISGATGAVSRRERAVPSSKGGLIDIVMSVGSAGGFTAGVEMIKAWLNRDSSRTIKLQWYENGKLEALELGGGVFRDGDLARLRSLAQLEE